MTYFPLHKQIQKEDEYEKPKIPKNALVTCPDGDSRTICTSTNDNI